MRELKMRIKKAGIMQNWLAEKIGVSSVTLNQWLTDVRDMPDNREKQIKDIITKIEKATV